MAFRSLLCVLTLAASALLPLAVAGPAAAESGAHRNPPPPPEHVPVEVDLPG